MKEYNFDENKSMGETVRIDDIKLKLSEMEEQGTAGDFDDDDYDDGFDGGYEDEYEDEGGDTAEIPIKRTKEPREIREPKEQRERREPKGGVPPKKKKNGGGSGRVLIYVLVAIVMVAAVAAAVIVVSAGNAGRKNNAEANETTEYFYGVVASVSNNKFEIIDTQVGKTGFYTLGDAVTVTKEDGRKAAYSTVTRGDIIYVGLSKDAGEVISIEYTDDVWEKEDFDNVEVDTENRTISNGTRRYSYDKNTLFIYNGDFIKDGDLTKEDVVTLRGIGDTVWTVTVEKYHGYIKIENADRIEKPVITVDGKEAEFTDNMTPVSAGAHKLGISGSNIDELTVDIHITAGEIYSVDMASVQEKTGVLTFNINADNCIILVDGKQVSADSPVVLSMGTYTISVSAEGYKTYNGTIDVNEPLVEADIQLEKLQVKTASITVESNPAGATVYANGAVIGVTPFTTQINYGDYQISIKKDGYADYNLNTTVNDEQKTISVLLTEE